MDNHDLFDQEMEKLRQNVGNLTSFIEQYRFKKKEEIEALERYPLYQAETDYLTRRTNAK